MSGGALNYGYSKIEQLVEDIQEKLDNNAEHQLTEETITLIESTKNKLIMFAKITKEIEWLYSGDNGEESFWKNIKKIIATDGETK